jgi:hypothetical protein
MATASSFQYGMAEAVRDAVTMRKSTSDFVSGLMALCNLNCPIVKRRANPMPRLSPMPRREELTELFDPGVSSKDRLMEYRLPEDWHQVFIMDHSQDLSISLIIETSFGLKVDLVVLSTAIEASKESLGLTGYVSNGVFVPAQSELPRVEPNEARRILNTACDQLAQTICRILRDSEPGFRAELERNKTMRALFTAVVSAVLLGREHINLCISALPGVQEPQITGWSLPLQLGAVEACSFRDEFASVGPVLQEVLAANSDNDVLSAIVRAVLLGSQRTDLLSSNGHIPYDESSEVVPAWDFPIVLELLAQSWHEAVPSNAHLPSTYDGNGKWGGFSRLMGAC